MKSTKYVIAGVVLAMATGVATAGGGKHGHHGKWLEKLDANADGVITADEMAAKRQERFAKLDANADGYITAAELESHAAERGKTRHGKHAQRHIERQDTDGDGQVSLGEFNAGHEKRFAKLDENGDGVISADEIEAHRAHRHGRYHKDKNKDES